MLRVHSAPSARVGRRDVVARVAFAIFAVVGFAGGASAQGAGFVAQGSAPLVDPLTPATVAAFEVQVPASPTFLLRGTLPVPPGTYGGAGPSATFMVVEPGGTRVPAQVEVVSRYASASQGADVVELIARVRRPPSATAGQRWCYPIVLGAPAPIAVPSLPFAGAGLVLGPTDLGAPVYTLLLSGGGLAVRARDAFGHEYRLELLDPAAAATLTKHGPAHAEVRVAGTMVPVAPVSGPSGTLPHHFGVHAYLGTWAGESVVTLDLRVHNGHDGGNPQDPTDDPLGKVYFERIELDLPAGFGVVESVDAPGTGASYPLAGRTRWQLVEPLPGDKLHVMPSQGQFHRRLAIAAPQSLERAKELLDGMGVGFARRGIAPGGQRLWSWWNPATPRWFAQNFLLPHLEHVGMNALRSKLAADLTLARTHYEQGTGIGNYPIVEARMGWSHPWGISYGGMTGGTEIHIFDGVRTVESASLDGLRYFRLLHTMHTDRQPTALYDQHGAPTRLEKWLVAGANPYVPFGFYMKLQGPHDPFGFNNAPTFQTQAVVAAGRQPPYEATLLSYQPHDMQHLIRYTRSAKVLAWLTNDSLAKDDILMQAELIRLSYHRHLNGASGFMDVTGMRFDIEQGLAWPGRGIDFGRGEGWGVDTVTSAYALGTPFWRSTAYSWFQDVGITVALALSPCNGHLFARVQNKMLDGKYRAAQSFEDSIVHNALRGVVETVFRGRDPAFTALVDDVLRMQYFAFVGPLQWNSQLGGPKDIYAIGPLDVAAGVWCNPALQPADGYVPTVNTFQTFSTLAYGFLATGDPVFLDRGLQMFGTDPIGKLFHPSGNNVENRAAMLALAQWLLGQL